MWSGPNVHLHSRSADGPDGGAGSDIPAGPEYIRTNFLAILRTPARFMTIDFSETRHRSLPVLPRSIPQPRTSTKAATGPRAGISRGRFLRFWINLIRLDGPKFGVRARQVWRYRGAFANSELWTGPPPCSSPCSGGVKPVLHQLMVFPKKLSSSAATLPGLFSGIKCPELAIAHPASGLGNEGTGPFGKLFGHGFVA